MNCVILRTIGLKQSYLIQIEEEQHAYPRTIETENIEDAKIFSIEMGEFELEYLTGAFPTRAYILYPYYTIQDKLEEI